MIYTRRAIEEDLGVLLPLCRQFHGESPVHRQLAFDDGKVVRLVTACINDPDWLALVACDDDGDIVGMMLIYCLESFFGLEREVGDLTFYVVPEARGGRAALLMMKEAMGWATMKRASRVQFGVTTGINDEQAVKFFGKFGFEQTGTLLQRTMQLSD